MILRGLVEGIELTIYALTFRWSIGYHLDTGVLDAISNLPFLEHLKFIFCHGMVDFDRLLSLRSPNLSKLKSLSVHFSFLASDSPYREPYSVAKRSLCYLIANAPALQVLNVGSSTSHWLGTPFVDLDALFVYLQGRPNFQPSLRNIGFGVLNFPTPLAKGFFASLSCLELPNDRSEDEAVWPALRAAGINLAVIKVKWPSARLLRYLSNYHGLRGFHMDMCSSNGSYAEDGVLQSLLTSALAAHRTTLEDLRFAPSPLHDVERSAAVGRPDTMLWDIPGLLVLLQPFTRVERLELVHYRINMADENERVAFVSYCLGLSPSFHFSVLRTDIEPQRNRLTFSQTPHHLLAPCRPGPPSPMS